MLSIERFTPDQATEVLDDLLEILRDSVDGGASIGFLPPLDLDMGRQYWQGVFDDVKAGTRILLNARLDGRLIGTAQLDLPQKPNARIRAEVQKMLVHTQFRRQGVARALLATLDEIAREDQRLTLVLDTRKGDPSELLYQGHGYVRLGEIPQYVLDPQADGGYTATVIYYRLL